MTPSVLFLLGASAPHEPPVLDLDGTIFLQFVLFVLMYLMLQRFVFKPYLQLKEQRTANMEGAQAEAKHIETTTQELEREYKKDIAMIQKELDAERLRLYQDMQQQEQAKWNVAQQQAEQQRAASQAQVQKDMANVQHQLEQEVPALAAKLASRILHREVQT